MMRTTFLLAALLLVLPAAAEENNRSYGPGTLTPDQVRDCVRDRNEVVAQNQILSAEKAALEPGAAEIERIEAGLVQQQTQMAHSRAELVRLKAAASSNNTSLDAHLRATTEFKQKTTAFNALVKSYNEGVTAQQQRRDRHNAAVVALNANLERLRLRANAVDGRCTGARAYQEDVRAAKEELNPVLAPLPANEPKPVP